MIIGPPDNRNRHILYNLLNTISCCKYQQTINQKERKNK